MPAQPVPSAPPQAQLPSLSEPAPAASLKGIPPVVFLGENHMENRRGDETQILKAYKEKYGRNASPLLAVELPNQFQASFNTYVKSARTPQDEEKFWMSAVASVNPAITPEKAKGLADNYYMAPGRGEETRGLIQVATQAVDQGYRVALVDQYMPRDMATGLHGLETRNSIMSGRIAQLAGQSPTGGVIVIDGAAHNQADVGVATLPQLLAKKGFSNQVSLNLTNEDMAGEIPVANPKEAMAAIDKQALASAPFQRSSQTVAQGEQTQRTLAAPIVSR
ncbi:MAG: hypothetical protein PW734_06480 [Verrucomicrobium sp.]|nr:hypothetical protein [Verrucomicrobium sp.]